MLRSARLLPLLVAAAVFCPLTPAHAHTVDRASTARPAASAPSPDVAAIAGAMRVVAGSRSKQIVRQVTHGTAVLSPARAVPWALSLWLEPKNSSGTGGTGQLQFLCTGTAISSRTILTAAHCTRQPGYLYAQVGANTLKQPARMVPVEAIGADPHYRDAGFNYDIALLRPMSALNLRSYARLATPAVAQLARTGRVSLSVYGWGRTETGALTGTLRTAGLQPAPASATKAFGRAYNPRTMIAAGRELGSGRWVGTCSGDSGGPLTTTQGRTTYVVGVTNYGRRSCDAAPSVFASVGDYGPWTAAQQRALPILARSANTALPVNLALPSTSGTVALGQTLTCRSGLWTRNATRVGSGWYRDDTFLGLGAAHVLTAEDAGTTLRCVGAAAGRAGSRAEAGPSIPVPQAPATDGYVAITGVGLYGMPDPGTVASCAGVTATTAATTTTYDWLASPTWDTAGGQIIATGQTLTLDVPTLQRLAGQYLVCRATTSNVMGSITSQEWVHVAPLSPPTGFVTLNLPSYNAAVGMVVTCAVSNLPAGASVTYRWARVLGYEAQQTLPATATLFPGQTGPTYTVAGSDLNTTIACEATMTNWQGSSSQVSSRYLSHY